MSDSLLGHRIKCFFLQTEKGIVDKLPDEKSRNLEWKYIFVIQWSILATIDDLQA